MKVLKKPMGHFPKIAPTSVCLAHTNDICIKKMTE